MAQGKIKQGITVVATGRIGTDPVSRGAFTQVRLAVSQPGKKRPDGEWDNVPSMWFSVMAKGDQLDNAGKGDSVTVTGRLSMNEYEGKQQWTIWAETVSEAVGEASERSSGTANGHTPAQKTPKIRVEPAKAQPETELAFPA